MKKIKEKTVKGAQEKVTFVLCVFKVILLLIITTGLIKMKSKKYHTVNYDKTVLFNIIKFILYTCSKLHGLSVTCLINNCMWEN